MPDVIFDAELRLGPEQAQRVRQTLGKTTSGMRGLNRELVNHNKLNQEQIKSQEDLFRSRVSLTKARGQQARAIALVNAQLRRTPDAAKKNQLLAVRTNLLSQQSKERTRSLNKELRNNNRLNRERAKRQESLFQSTVSLARARKMQAAAIGLVDSRLAGLRKGEDPALRNRLVAQRTRLLAEQTKQHGRHGDSILANIKNAAKWAAVYFVLYRAIRLGTSIIKSAVTTINEINFSLVKLNRVLIDSTGITGVYAKVLPKLVAISIKYGASLTSVIDASVEWARQGRKTSDVIKLTEATILGANVAFIDAAQLAKILTSALNQFNLSADDAIRIVDVLNEVSKRYAVTSDVLGNALRRSGLAARNAGIEYEELVGLITAISEATQLSGERIGTALRTIFTFVFRPETIKTVEDITRRFGDQKVVITDLGGRTRSFANILAQLVAVWDRLSPIQQKQISQSIAGVRRSQEFLALIERYPTALNATRDAFDSTGSATAENVLLMDSLQKSLERLKATMKGIFVAAGERGIRGAMVKAVKAGTSLIKVISGVNTGFIKMLVLIPAIFFAMKGLISVFGTFGLAAGALLAISGVIIPLILVVRELAKAQERLDRGLEMAAKTASIRLGEFAKSTRREIQASEGNVRLYKQRIILLKSWQEAGKDNITIQDKLRSLIEKVNESLSGQARTAPEAISLLREEITRLEQRALRLRAEEIEITKRQLAEAKRQESEKVALLEQERGKLAELDKQKERLANLDLKSLERLEGIVSKGAALAFIEKKRRGVLENISKLQGESAIAARERVDAEKGLLGLEGERLANQAKTIELFFPYKTIIDEANQKIAESAIMLGLTGDHQKHLNNLSSIYSKTLGELSVKIRENGESLEDTLGLEERGLKLSELTRLQAASLANEIAKSSDFAMDQKRELIESVLAFFDLNREAEEYVIKLEDARRKINQTKIESAAVSVEIARMKFEEAGFLELLEKEIQLRQIGKNQIDAEVEATLAVLDATKRLQGELDSVRGTYNNIIEQGLIAAIDKTAQWSDLLKGVGQELLRSRVREVLRPLNIGKFISTGIDASGTRVATQLRQAILRGGTEAAAALRAAMGGRAGAVTAREVSTATSRTATVAPSSIGFGVGLPGGNVELSSFGLPGSSLRVPFAQLKQESKDRGDFLNRLEKFGQTPGGKTVGGGISGALQAYYASGGNLAATAIGTGFGAAGALLPQPFGGIVAILGTLIASAFSKGDKRVSIQTQEAQFQTASKIDISNKRLEIISRYLLDIRRSLEPYPLQESFAFRSRIGTGVHVQNLIISGKDAEGGVIKAISNQLNLDSTRGAVSL